MVSFGNSFESFETLAVSGVSYYAHDTLSKPCVFKTSPDQKMLCLYEEVGKGNSDKQQSLYKMAVEIFKQQKGVQVCFTIKREILSIS